MAELEEKIIIDLDNDIIDDIDKIMIKLKNRHSYKAKKLKKFLSYLTFDISQG